MRKNKKFDVFEFLKEYRKYPCLWRKKSVDYKNRSKRDAAEAQLLQLPSCSNFSTNLLRKKIHTLRGTYNQEKTKVKKSIRKGISSEPIYKPRLAWYEVADAFLRENEKETESNLETDDNENSKEILEEQSSANSSSVNGFENRTNRRTKINNKKRKGKVVGPNNKKKLNTSLDDAVSLNASNEFTEFGNHVASQLWALPLNVAVKAVADIQNILTGARLSVSWQSDNFSNNNQEDTNNEDLEENVENNYIQVNESLGPQVRNLFSNWVPVNEESSKSCILNVNI